MLEVQCERDIKNKLLERLLRFLFVGTRPWSDLAKNAALVQSAVGWISHRRELVLPDLGTATSHPQLG